MDRRGGHRPRLTRGLHAVAVTTGAVAAYLVVAASLAVPANAVECGPGQTPVPNPETGKIECQGGGPGGPGRPGGPGEPAPEPADGTIDHQERIERCPESRCSLDVWCVGTDLPYTHYERTVVYRTGQGWVPVAGPDGQWVETQTGCEPPRRPAAPTAADVWSAVSSIGIDGAMTAIQPANGRSLVNLDTNFYIESADRQDRVFALPVGPVAVQIRAVPTSYRWDFDDGTPPVSRSTPGHPYPNMDVTHVYEATGLYHPSVTIIYTVHWAYNGNWQVLPQPIQARTSPTTDLRVVESTPVLKR